MSYREECSFPTCACGHKHCDSRPTPNTGRKHRIILFRIDLMCKCPIFGGNIILGVTFSRFFFNIYKCCGKRHHLQSAKHDRRKSMSRSRPRGCFASHDMLDKAINLTESACRPDKSQMDSRRLQPGRRRERRGAAVSSPAPRTCLPPGPHQPGKCGQTST